MDPFEDPDRVSLAWRGLTEITVSLAERLREQKTRHLDLSNNSLKDLSPLLVCTQLETLVVDSNELTSFSVLPRLPNLRVFSANRNRIANLPLIVSRLQVLSLSLSLLPSSLFSFPSDLRGRGMQCFMAYAAGIIPSASFSLSSS
jgi:Leucine-rich repeat (LRR) protein